MKHWKWYSIFSGSCPRCHEGQVFYCKNPYNLKRIMDMHEECEHCGLKYKPEPGFFFGATYVSYAIAVAIVVTISVALTPFVSFYENFEIYASATIGAIVILAPVIFRLSRHGWLKMFNKYDKDAVAKHQQSKFVTEKS